MRTDGLRQGMADTVRDGYRLIPKMGNTQKRTSWTLKLPPVSTFYWGVQAIDGAFLGSKFATQSGTLDVRAAGSSALMFEVHGANPVRGATQFRFALPKAAHAELSVYDLAGRLIDRLVNSQLSAGDHTAGWNPGRGVSSTGPGVYFARLTVDNEKIVRRIVVLK